VLRKCRAERRILAVNEEVKKVLIVDGMSQTKSSHVLILLYLQGVA
jgi:hypothetical protein